MTDGPALHFVASIGAVCRSATQARLLMIGYCRDQYAQLHGTRLDSGLITAVCSPADVLKSRIMNSHGAGTTSTLQVIKTS